MEQKLKHLEFIQDVISRMNVNSFILRGWAVTLVAALFAFAAKDAKIEYVLITYFSTPLFWILDGYYLCQERKFRDLYDIIRKKSENEIDFDMDTSSFKKPNNKWITCILSKTNIIFYGTILAVTLSVMFLIN